MRTYSIVFLDIDGTLLNSQQQVLPCTQHRLKYLQSRNIPIILCSARPPEGVRLVARQVGLHSPMACYNGALVFDQDGAILQDVGIQAPLALEFQRFVRQHFPDLVVSAYLYDIWLAEDPQNLWIQREAEISGCTPLKGSLEKAAQTATHIHKLLCIGDAIRIRALQQAVCRQFPQLMALRSKSTYLEILSPESTKGSAVRVLLGHYGLDAADAVAFGDSDVDMDMLQSCALGVAMGNAPRQVQEAADLVTASNDDEGVYIVLKSLRLKAPPQIPGAGSEHGCPVLD